MNISLNISQILIKIWDATAGELKHLRWPKPRIEKLRQARERLKARNDDIDMRIIEAQRMGEIPTNEIQQWQKEVKELEGKADETEQDFERRRCLGAWSWNCFSVNRRVAKRMKDIDKLMTRYSDATPVAMRPPPPAVVEIPETNSPFGIQDYKREILGYVHSSNAAEVIGVYGMGGVGKTTLLKSINNHHKLEDVDRFDHVIWAVASKECKIEKLQRDIANWLELHLKQDDTEEGHANKLCHFLNNKNCLLLLDDLWAPLDLAMLGMVPASSGQGEQQKRKVVVFTTRDVQVCGGMTANREMQIKCLEPKEAWELFQSKASDAIASDRGIERIAHQIAEECAGLPLALITVGVAMSRKKSSEAWSDALRLMKESQMPKITRNNEAYCMFSAFKLSYKSLEDDDTRGCLLSCALWPEDHLIDKKGLIECWMGLGLIDEAGAIHKAYNRGHSHIETLKAACLLEPGDDDEERKVKMHDVIRDMALWEASHCGKEKFKWIVRAGVAASQAYEGEGWHEAERVSLMYNDIASLPNQLPTCSKLSVLMLQHNNKLQEIHGTSIQSMCSLTYLDLENTHITEIPKEIGMLSQLRHLNLSGTYIEELPAELGCLVKLNYLFLRYMCLTTVAKGAISNLLSLKFLDLTENITMDEKWLDEVEGLKGCQKCSICIDIRTAAALQRLCSLPHVLIWRLNVLYCFDSANLNDIIKSRNTRQSMEQLRIIGGHSKELLISEGNEEAGGLECLKYLQLQGLAVLEEITWKGVLPHIVFPNLRELNIFGCHKLRNINWVLQLPSLSVLYIESCPQMVELISDEGSSSPSPFGLRKMMLVYMSALERISWRPLYIPNMEKIEVLNCPLLRKLPFEKANRLKVIRCQQKWWNNLEWEDESIKNSLSPFVTFGKDVVPLARVEPDPTPYSTVGIEECMNIILRHIDSANATEVIGIYGMAGVGKTTLLRRIINHINVDKFNYVFWAVASRECQMERLQMHIVYRLGYTLLGGDTERDIASQLFDLLEDQDCLLFLDDLCEHLDLTKLGMARATPMARATQGRRKQKRKVVVFTTRNEQVCSDMNAGTKVEIKCLGPDKAWELFRTNTNEDAIGSDDRIESISRQIAQECAGLPLALITAAKAMSKMKSWEEWSKALTMMKNEADPMLSAFKLSFDSLEDDNMRGRLLSCTLWPEYLSIDKDKLIECWMALGLIDEVGMIHEAYNKGHSHIETLKAACLLEPGVDEEREVKMYHVIRDMAMASDCDKEKFKWIVRAGVAASQAFEGEGWHEAQRVLLMYNDIASLPNQLPTFSKISVLMLQCNYELNEIHGTFIQAMCSLTYLDLEKTHIKEIPKEIGMLSQLRHLNLSRTYIQELPAELGCLVKLNYLFVRRINNFRTVSKGAISNLLSLKFLDLTGNITMDEKWLDEVEGLKGCQKCSIGTNIGTAAALRRLCSLPRALIWRLNVQFYYDSANPNQLLDDLIKSRNTRQSMEQLEIYGMKSKELLISEGNEEAGGLECLKYLQLGELEELEEITWKGVLPHIVFPNLRELNIFRCHELRNVSWVLQLPSLSVLDITDCSEMVELISDEGCSSPTPFSLRKMRLGNMWKLERISDRCTFQIWKK